MILRATLFGFVLWLVTTGAFRFFGAEFFFPGENGIFLLLAATPVVMAAITFVAIKLLHPANIDTAEAAIGIAAPGMGLDVYAVNAFPSAFPNLDPALDGAFGAIKLIGYTAILLTGLFMTRIAPQDERI